MVTGKKSVIGTLVRERQGIYTWDFSSGKVVMNMGEWPSEKKWIVGWVERWNKTKRKSLEGRPLARRQGLDGPNSLGPVHRILKTPSTVKGEGAIRTAGNKHGWKRIVRGRWRLKVANVTVWASPLWLGHQRSRCTEKPTLLAKHHSPGAFSSERQKLELALVYTGSCFHTLHNTQDYQLIPTRRNQSTLTPELAFLIPQNTTAVSLPLWTPTLSLPKWGWIFFFKCLPRASLRLWSSYPCLLHSWDYKHVPPHMTLLVVSVSEIYIL
jgi:hypothetical protein